jgi:SulP family sulfate permease
VASVAGLLIVVSYNMSKWRTFFAILRSGRGDAALLLVTFLVTLFVDVTMAIEAGFVFAAFQFMHRMTMVSNVKELTNNFMANNGLYIEEHIVKHNLPKGVAVFEITGPLFFAVAHKFKESLNEISIKPKIVILRMRNVPIIDSTGIVTLLNVIQSLSEQDIRLVISEYKYDRVDAKLTTLLISKLDKHNIHGTLSEAIERCEDILSGKVEELSVL